MKADAAERRDVFALDVLAESRLALALLLVFTAALRVYAVQHARFDDDESTSWEAALDIVGASDSRPSGRPSAVRRRGSLVRCSTT